MGASLWLVAALYVRDRVSIRLPCSRTPVPFPTSVPQVYKACALRFPLFTITLATHIQSHKLFPNSSTIMSASPYLIVSYTQTTVTPGIPIGAAYVVQATPQPQTLVLPVPSLTPSHQLCIQQMPISENYACQWPVVTTALSTMFVTYK